MSETANTVVEPSKPSKLSRVKSAAAGAAIIVIPTATVVGLTFLGFKTSRNQLAAANATLEAAKLAKQM